MCRKLIGSIKKNCKTFVGRLLWIYFNQQKKRLTITISIILTSIHYDLKTNKQKAWSKNKNLDHETSQRTRSLLALCSMGFKLLIPIPKLIPLSNSVMILLPTNLLNSFEPWMTSYQILWAFSSFWTKCVHSTKLLLKPNFLLHADGMTSQSSYGAS